MRSSTSASPRPRAFRATITSPCEIQKRKAGHLPGLFRLAPNANPADKRRGHCPASGGILFRGAFAPFLAGSPRTIDFRRQGAFQVPCGSASGEARKPIRWSFFHAKPSLLGFLGPSDTMIFGSRDRSRCARARFSRASEERDFHRVGSTERSVTAARQSSCLHGTKQACAHGRAGSTRNRHRNYS